MRPPGRRAVRRGRGSPRRGRGHHAPRIADGIANVEAAPAADALWRRLVNLVMENYDASRRAIREATGLPAGRVRVLRRLSHGPRTLRELAEAIGSDAPATTVIVNELEDSGLVLREPHPTNRRAKLVSLTAAGRAVVSRARRIIEATPPGFAALPPADLAALARVIDSLTHAPGAANEPDEPDEPE